MKSINSGFLSALLLSMSSFSALSYGQDEDSVSVEEIIVTARKREESLQEIPVTISVISADLLNEAGVNDLYDLFGLVAGVDIEDPNGDRNGANPAIRGVQAGGNGANITNRRVNSFLDGMPLTGQQGTIRFIDTSAVEFYSGPQSAAFGRSTFTGAINYVSADPGEEFDGSIQVQTSEFGRDSIRLGLSGPITENLGYTFNAEVSEFDGPDSWRTTEGFGVGGTSTDYFSGKLVWAPTENLDIEVRYLNGKTDDDSPSRFILSDEQFASCNNIGQLSDGRQYIIGEYDCDIGNDVLIPTNYELALPQEALDAFDAGEITQQELDNFQAFADSYSIPGGPQVFNNRERLSAELTFQFDESLLQILAFTGEEDSLVWYDADLGDDPLVFSAAEPAGVNMMGQPIEAVPASVTIPMGMGLNNMANPNSVEEEYLEVRWVSPDAQRLRWSVGASYYDYVYDQLNFDQYNAILNPELQAFDSVGEVLPTMITNEEAENFGIFFNLTYDLTVDTTISLEGRFQRDEISSFNQLAEEYIQENGVDNELGLDSSRASGTSNAFLPRISLTSALNDEINVYAQVALGNSPGGSNPEWLTPSTIEAFRDTRNQIVNAVDTLDLDDEIAVAFVDSLLGFDETTFRTYEQEEIINYEVGVKALLWDESVQITSALYLQDWTDQQGGLAIDFSLDDFGGTEIDGADYSPATQTNLGDSRLIGWDSTGSWQINDRWSLNGTLSLHRNRTTDFCNTGAAGFGLANNRFPGIDDVQVACRQMNGTELQRTPAFSGSLSGTYRRPIGNTGLNLSIRGDIRHTGAQWMDSANIMELPAVTTFNLNVGVNNRTWSATVAVNNLTNDDTPRIVRVNNTNVFEDFELNVTPPNQREVSLRLRYNL